MNESRFVNDLIGRLVKDLDELAHGGCQFPKADPFEHGKQVGRYEGVQAALQRLENLIEEDAEKERKS